MKKSESAPTNGNENKKLDESGFMPYDPEDREETLYQFNLDGVKVYKKASGIYVNRKLAEGLYKTLLKSQQAEIKNLCREIDAECQSHPKMRPQEVANNKTR